MKLKKCMEREFLSDVFIAPLMENFHFKVSFYAAEMCESACAGPTLISSSQSYSLSVIRKE